MPAILEFISSRDAEAIFASLKSRFNVLCRERGIQSTSMGLEIALDRTLHKLCSEAVPREQLVSENDTGEQWGLWDELYCTIDSAISFIKVQLDGFVTSPISEWAFDLSTRFSLQDVNGVVLDVPVFLLNQKSFQEMDWISKRTDEIEFSEPGWASNVSIASDWEYVWSKFADEEFCATYWHRFVAVFQGEVVGSGTSDYAARLCAAESVSRCGDYGVVPVERFVVEFIGEAWNWNQ